MPHVVYPSSRVEAERTIAIARIVLAATALLALWLDPIEPPVYADLTYRLQSVYLLYSVAVLAWTFVDVGEWQPLGTHAVDVLAFSIFQYLTLGPSSPFFVYFIFSMFCGAVRWDWRGSLATGIFVVAFYVAMAGSINGALPVPRLEVNRFVVRLAYLAVATGMLVYLGRYEARLRTEIERLARWPSPVAAEPTTGIGRILEYGGRLMQASCVVVLWEANDEPATHLARWTPQGVDVHSVPPGSLQPVTDEAVADATFICEGPVAQSKSVRVADRSGRLLKRDGLPLDERISELLTGTGLATSPISAGLLTGRVYFSALGTPPLEAVPLTEVLAREIGASLEQFQFAVQREELAAREERIRVARDLHDGVLQGLTGVRLELRAIANEDAPPDRVREELLSLERALAMEQRELRYFIAGLEPGADRRIEQSSALATRLDTLRQRLALEWKTPVTLRVSPTVQPLAQPIEDAVPLMVHEAAVNAMKHANASRVTVDVEESSGHLRITVTDDGSGFSFKGRYNHEALATSHVGPRSLFDRVSALDGHLSIDSTDRGSRVEVLIPL